MDSERGDDGARVGLGEGERFEAVGGGVAESIFERGRKQARPALVNPRLQDSELTGADQNAKIACRLREHPVRHG